VGDGESIIVMGGVGYPIRSNGVDAARFGKAADLIGKGLRIFANIGEYAITPSREAIQLDDITVDKLRAKLTNIYDKIIPILQEKMDKFDGNTYEAKCFFASLKNDFKFMPAFSLNWHGAQIDGRSIKLNSDLCVSFVGQQRTWRTTISTTRAVESIPVTASASRSNHVILDDLKVGAFSRCKAAIEKNYEERQKAGTSHYRDRDAYFLVKKDKWDDFVKFTGWKGAVKKVSDMEKSTVAKSSTASVKGLQQLSQHDYLTPFDKQNLDIHDSVIIFPILRGRVDFGGFSSSSVAATKEIITHCVKLAPNLETLWRLF
jgi:hypothetical protein